MWLQWFCLHSNGMKGLKDKRQKTQGLKLKVKKNLSKWRLFQNVFFMSSLSCCFLHRETDACFFSMDAFAGGAKLLHCGDTVKGVLQQMPAFPPPISLSLCCKLSFPHFLSNNNQCHQNSRKASQLTSHKSAGCWVQLSKTNDRDGLPAKETFCFIVFLVVCRLAFYRVVLNLQ